MQDERRPAAPNYTAAALWMGLVNLLWVFAVLWALFGLPAVIALGWVLNRGISRLALRRGRA